MMNGTKLKICKGKHDEKNGCKHEWEYFVEAGGQDNNAYPYCPKCNLLCRICIPAECVDEKKIKSFFRPKGVKRKDEDCGCF